MADGNQHAFHLPHLKATSRLRPGEIVVDLFAGGGGASTALEQALGRPVDIAINHNPWAVSMHAANHPYTRHLCEDVWQADPVREVAGRPVGWLHASPDCTHFSQAKGGQPRSGKVRALSWCAVRWTGKTRPRIVSLENVHQILKWGPLVAKRCKATGRVLKLDGTVAAPGERVPVEQQFLVPDKRRQGETWRKFVAALRALGYQVEWRRLKACDYGAGTSRERLFLIARRDGQPIVWPAPTHGPGRAHPYVTAADCIDWSIACPSIFTRAKPLADATMRRIARGIQRYVIDAKEPFIVHATHGGERRPHGAGEPLPTITAANRGELMAVSPTIVQCANASANGVAAGSNPLGTVTSWPKGGAHAVAAATLVQAAHGEGKPGGVQRWGSGARAIEEPAGTFTASGSGGYALAAATLVQTGYGEREGQAPRVPGLDKPIGTLVDGQKHAAVTAALVKFRGDSDGADVQAPAPTLTSGAGAARPAGAAHALGLMTAFLEQAAGGPNSNTSRPRAATEPVSTISTKGSQQRLVAANMVTLRRNCDGADAAEPVRTITAGAEHHALVECTLSPEHEAGALQVAAFLLRYYGTGGQLADVRNPAHAITTKDRLALVTVTIKCTPYVIVDIGLRMLQRHELFRAQGFPADYIIDRTADGRTLSVSRSVSMCGNSVSPPPQCALVAANADAIDVDARAA
ncbi:DNA cytosine methyltransferase [Luteimonas sp BLCC-B24]|uniref:DNA cytosine methyltransferase n=1 Tax=Luteimonas sp. BLCC-B24 TaxID=3025317 RepID=UPI00234DBA58|nr:DNA cytosine methyltransferase [Luteimonas sp. BLCC-B24]MDC7806383.1 DNA cytosine methyltransferase [Luteimonas sp. BLCC-B24]